MEERNPLGSWGAGLVHGTKLFQEVLLFCHIPALGEATAAFWHASEHSSCGFSAAAVISFGPHIIHAWQDGGFFPHSACDLGILNGVRNEEAVLPRLSFILMNAYLKAVNKHRLVLNSYTCPFSFAF